MASVSAGKASNTTGLRTLVCQEAQDPPREKGVEERASSPWPGSCVRGDAVQAAAQRSMVPSSIDPHPCGILEGQTLQLLLTKGIRHRQCDMMCAPRGDGRGSLDQKASDSPGGARAWVHGALSPDSCAGDPNASAVYPYCLWTSDTLLTLSELQLPLL